MAASPAIQPANDPSDFVALAKDAAAGAKALVAEATARVKARVTGPEGKLDAGALEREQHAAHGLSWLATYGEAVRELADYAERLKGEGTFGETEALLVKIGVGEYLDQMFGGIPMSQGEIVRPTALGFTSAELASLRTPAIDAAIAEGNTPANRAALVAKIREATTSGAATIGLSGLDEDMEAIRTEMRRFGKAEVVEQAQEWHRENAYIPMPIIEKMAELGVFGLTIPEEYGGMGMPKAAMCVVSEELSRAYIGVGSLGTRSEIAAELILCGGTEEQKQRFLPRIASGEILPTAVFTEPNTGSDLASLRTKAVKEGDVWKITGNKTWITHPVRADIMTVLVRTKPEEKGHRGLSMLIAEKPRGSDENPFPVDGLSGGEIEVLGYRGMKEYELSFEGFSVPAANLLGEVEGKGFAQLMQTFESARIQTAARAIGVAQSALDIGLRYAEERVQFGKALVEFPRVADKLAMMAVEINIARQLTYFSAREKDEGKRCDLEAGMAKLLGARVAWAAADNALQIHGGNGFALEYPISRVLCDARILSIFEGAAEIQAQVIARRLLEQ
ncbi:acyl-CoA dehydrogenase family protein [Methylorubrum rhodesianum]|jgi:(2S)-methylsuccinyl-CoA dehydrogenase|uniref:Acyl-CoA dehydrogenase family protein n=1 Tax=Methylorubrum rhodesianum TaxID=29427 RepID=A0ABU9ZCE4_9HYPH|nr:MULTISPECIES: acyl-CoA dehydrogenase family protein [Methylorubrum]MBB5763903.1 (2S)-methylsuccinyl-CoA dehydrogenase [Methylorubrum rhodesianum]MBI1690334.1 acyl-CoA dehydrogenase [Methylorubrum sp. DB1722]MBK3401572.1 acyl-CoA dehydrogenase family protein [Methylorubrum rhodesianum]MBY0141971.1 acyl-CoA dehydrogenase family protein [Methylorubrum populi]